MLTEDKSTCIVDVEVTVGIYGFPAAVMEPIAELAPVIFQESEKPVVVISTQESRSRMVSQGTADNFKAPLRISTTIGKIAEEDDARRAAPASSIVLAECNDCLKEVRATVDVAYGIGEEHDPTCFALLGVNPAGRLVTRVEAEDGIAHGRVDEQHPSSPHISSVSRL